MSAVDIALMDIKGKAFGVPCYELLGGKTRDRVRAYASQLQLGWIPDDAERFSRRSIRKAICVPNARRRPRWNLLDFNQQFGQSPVPLQQCKKHTSKPKHHIPPPSKPSMSTKRSR